MRADFLGFARAAVVLQLVTIVAPALLMAMVLTSSPRRTLLWRLPRWKTIPAAAALALALHPFIHLLNLLVMHLYPLAPEMKQGFDALESKFASADLGLLICCVAAVPAVCEELAFRGFILSGCRRLGSGPHDRPRAIFFAWPTGSCSNRSTPACWAWC